MPKLIQQHPYWLLALIAIVGYIFYQTLVASERYVSTAYVVLNSPSVESPNLNFGSLLTGSTVSSDLLLLREHLLSVDMLRKLDQQLDLRSHYSQPSIDRLSRLRKADVPIEELHRYYLKRVEVELDDYANVLRVQVSAFDAQMAHAINQLMLAKGEAHMNAMGQRLASEQVRFIEQQAQVLAERLHQAREALLLYQNEHGLISPRAAVESLMAVVAGLERELASLQAQRTALATTRSPQSPEMIALSARIQALEEQIAVERTRMAAQSGEALNRITLEYETLELQARFAQDLYSSALTMLESTRGEAIRQLKQISILQSPTLPEFSTEPRRLYSITVFTLLTLLFTLILQMLVAIVRDHRE